MPAQTRTGRTDPTPSGAGRVPTCDKKEAQPRRHEVTKSRSDSVRRFVASCLRGEKGLSREARPAAAGAGGVGVLEHEALAHHLVAEVDLGAAEVQVALLV